MNKLGKAAIAVSAAAAAMRTGEKFFPPRITEYEICSDRLDERLDGYKIVHISDYHCECMPELADMVKKAGADMIVSTGDMVNSFGSIERAVDLTARLAEIAPLYMVSGNHDVERDEHKKIEEICCAGRGKFLHDESVRIEHNGAEFVLSGIDDAGAADEEMIRRRIEKSLKKIYDGNEFHILLFHRANIAQIPARRGFDLILSGHMHGGQVYIPRIGGLISPKKNLKGERVFFPQYTGGRYRIGRTELIVSRGLGNPVPLPRICNRAEIVVIRLRTAERTA